MGIKSFAKFFQHLAEMEPKSLVLTKLVLDERAQLEVRLSRLREKIELGVNVGAKIQRDVKKLSEIALKKDPLLQVDYLDLLIESEESQARPGWKDRVKSLMKARDEAVEIIFLGEPGFDPWEKY